MATCETCGAVYPTNGLRGAIHEPSACRDVLAARVADLESAVTERAQATLDDMIARALAQDAPVICGLQAEVARLRAELERPRSAEWEDCPACEGTGRSCPARLDACMICGGSGELRSAKPALAGDDS